MAPTISSRAWSATAIDRAHPTSNRSPSPASCRRDIANRRSQRDGATAVLVQTAAAKPRLATPGREKSLACDQPMTESIFQGSGSDPGEFRNRIASPINAATSRSTPTPSSPIYPQAPRCQPPPRRCLAHRRSQPDLTPNLTQGDLATDRLSPSRHAARLPRWRPMSDHIAAQASSAWSSEVV